MNTSRVVGMVLVLAAVGAGAWAQAGPAELLQVASASRSHDAGDPGGSTYSADVFSSNGLFARFYAGYDYALLGDLTNAIQQTGAYYKSLGGGVTAGTTTDNSGVLMGAEWGQRMGDGTEISLAAEFVSSQSDIFGQFNPNSSSGESVGPNLLDVTVRYAFTLAQGGGNHTAFYLGGGWYHTIVDFNSTLTQNGTPQPDASGAFTGDTLGATAGLREEVQVGAFTLGISAYGRYARFGQVNASDISGLSQRLDTTGPYTLSEVNLGGYWSLEPVPTQVLPAYQLANLARPTVVDYSGFGGNLSFGFRF